MKYLIGNWKMQLTEKESVKLAEEIKHLVGPWLAGADIAAVLCPSFMALPGVRHAITDTPLALGAQDVFWEDKGAFTGEMSPVALKELGCGYCLVGHSERRQFCGETDEQVNRKTAALLRHNITPVVCVGETKEERNAGRRDEVVIGQVKAALTGNHPVTKIIIAYEPRWVIGTGVAVSPEDAAAMHALIRRAVSEVYVDAVIERHVHVIYGGAVDAQNLGAFLAQPLIEGVLVGGASLKPHEFRAMAALAAGRDEQ
jgi:triosephosphate isomerase